MEEIKGNTKNKGGRPKKNIKRSEQLAVMCTLVERTVIEYKAKNANVSTSEFLRTIALKGQVDRKQKVLPMEVLQFTATLNHLAANLNQVAKKRNSFDELNALERAELQYLSGQVKQLAKDIKDYLK
jgi:peptidoglycan hydrolase CwlO-like protein